MTEPDTRESARRPTDPLPDVLLERSPTSIEDSQIPSSGHIQFAFMVFTALVVMALTALVFGMVSHIFASLTPSIEADLERKATRGSAELARVTDVGLALGDREQIEKELTGYIDDPDVLAIVATDAKGKLLGAFGERDFTKDAFSAPAGAISRREDAFVAWATAEIEEVAIGRIAVVISTDRLRAGAELERTILWGAGIGSIIALLLSVAFARFYVGPLIRVIETSFSRLKRTTEAALQATKLKSEFLANMSHEIRTPMNGVMGMIELLGGTQLSEKQRRYATTLSNSAQALMTLLNDILDFSKIEAGKVEIRYATVSLRDVLEDILDMFAARAREKHLDLLCHIEPGTPVAVETDEDRLRQVLSNLVGNALKFTEVGQVVVGARLEPSSQRLIISVRDTGIGIEDDKQAELFDAFSQADGSMTRKYGGTGLGLTISRQLVSLMGGEIGLNSKRGSGSTFWFSLPLRELTEALSSRAETPRLSPHTLVVDDNETNRAVLEELLTGWGCTVLTADGGEAALVALEQADREGKPFDLLLSDLNMPDVDGATLARATRDTFGSACPKIVLITSTDIDDIDPSARAVIDDHLQKPVRARDLVRSINRVMAGVSQPFRATDPNRPAAWRRRKVLVVDDNPVNQEVMLESLAELGYRADVAENGKLAVEATVDTDYALILMDCQMPIMDGYRATGEIRRRESNKRHTPIIAVTAHAFQGEREKVLASGMDDYLTKPVKLASLRGALERWWPEGEDELEAGPSDPAPSSNAPEFDSAQPPPPRSAAVVRAFLRSVPEQLADIEAALSAPVDAEALRQAAHKLKGGCLAAREESLATICNSLEANPENRRELHRRLVAEFQVVGRQMWLEIGSPASIPPPRQPRSPRAEAS